MDFFGAGEIADVLEAAKSKALMDVVFSDTVSTSPPFYFEDSELEITTDRPDPSVKAKKENKGVIRERKEEEAKPQTTIVFSLPELSTDTDTGSPSGTVLEGLEPRRPVEVKRISALTQEIGPAGKPDIEEDRSDILGPTIELKIFLPSKAALKVRVSEDATAKKCIEAIIRQHNSQGMKPVLRTVAAAYELRMVEDDGAVDTDLPPLDANRLVRSFGDTTFALCGTNNAGLDAEGDDEDVTARIPVGQLLKVHLPHNLGIMVEKVEPDMKLEKVFYSIFRRLASRVKKIFVQADYYFRPMGATAQVNLSGGFEQRFDLQQTIKQLHCQLTEVELAEKVYADRPQPSTEEVTIDDSARVDDELTSQAAMFRLNEMTASQYTEYAVIKMNEKNNKTENRRLGIDFEKIYNHLPKSASSSSRKLNVKRPERFIRDICSLEYVKEKGGKTNFSRLRIIFEEKGEHQSYIYGLNDAASAAEIMAKLKFLINKHREMSVGSANKRGF